MRCLCSVESPARPFHLVVPKHATPSSNLGASSSVSLPRRRRPPQSFLNDDVGELGHTLLATTQSSKQPGKQEAQINGSDVLWALQRAGARKKKMMKKNKQEQEQRRVSSSAGTPRNKMEEIAVNHSNVRPLSINPNWATKLDDLEKRLRELSHAI